MRKIIGISLSFCMLLPLFSCNSSNESIDDKPQEKEKEKINTTGQIANAGFENGFEYWNQEGSVTLSDISHSGKKSLSIGSQKEYEGTIYQTITNLKPGYYYLTAKTLNEGNEEYCYLYGKTSGYDSKTMIPRTIKENEWKETIVRGIEVKEDGYLQIGVSSKGNGQNLCIDDISLSLEKNQEIQYPNLFGGAISWLDWEESMGAKYYDASGKEKDCLQILKENGCNFVRLELYNNPGSYKDSDGNYFPKDYKNQDSILALAKRANALGMQIELSFMYSDYWGNDVIPTDWKEEIDLLSTDEEKVDKLSSLLYDFTYNFMNRLKAESITPAYVSIGNEIDPGILIPYGDSSKNDANLAKFLNKGYEAVKAVSNDTKVVLHISCNAGDMHYNSQNGCGKWFFGLMEKNHVNYDIIGTSYYPFWAQTSDSYADKTALDLNDFINWCNLMIDTFDKDILLMESGYNWGTPGQLANNGAYKDIYPSSKEGQRDYVIDMLNAVKSVKDGRCIGALYWDPVLVRQSGIGWALYDDGKARNNCVETTTFFDFSHKALPVLNAYKYNTVTKIEK